MDGVEDGDDDDDGDSLNNLEEYNLGTSSDNPDTDGDYMPDGWEVTYGLDPTDKSDMMSDTDGDRIPAIYEYKKGTDPSDGSSVPTPDIYVTDPYGIQAALDASQNDYDIIQVADGTYANEYAGLDFKGKVLLLMSENGPENCIVDCKLISRPGNDGRGFQFASGEDRRTCLLGFTIRRGELTGITGMGISCHGSPTIRDCVMTECTGGRGAVFISFDASPAIENCQILNNTSFLGPAYASGIHFAGLGENDTIVRDCVIEGNIGGPALMLRPDSHIPKAGTLLIERCVIRGNTSAYGGGIHLLAEDSQYECEEVIIRDCLITGNTGNSGGGICHDGVRRVSIENCVIAGNTAVTGGGLSFYESGYGTGIRERVIVKNCTIVNNNAQVGGGIFHEEDQQIMVRNTILQGNVANGVADQIYEVDHPDGELTVEYSCIEDGWAGVGNIIGDPQLVLGNFRLKGTSPCIDAGNPVCGTSHDMDDEARWDHPDHANVIVNGEESIVDIGADEYADHDEDGMLDSWEVQYGLDPSDPSDAVEDLDGDGVTNFEEYQNNLDPGNSDTDGDGMPDGWEMYYELDPTKDTGDDGPAADIDQDGLSNIQEYEKSCNPRKKDTDNDGMGDGAEVLHGKNPTQYDVYTTLPFLEDFEPGVSIGFTGSDSSAGDMFGYSVSISCDSIFGNWAAIGAPGDDANRGSVYFCKDILATWEEKQKVFAGFSGDRFGCSVDIAGDIAVIGAYNFGGQNNGAAYIYRRNLISEEWYLQQEWTDFPDNSFYGHSVVVDGNTVVVGAYGENAVYVYSFMNGIWELRERIEVDEQAFGFSVDISDNNIIVSGWMNDKVYLFTEEDGNWQQEAVLSGIPGSYFGRSLSIKGNTVVVGAVNDESAGVRCGAAYVFEKTENGWLQTAQLLPSSGGLGDYFGWAVDVHNDSIVVGSRNAGGTGAVYNFRKVDDEWVSIPQFPNSNGGNLDYYGYSVAIENHHAFVGIPNDDDNGYNSGSVHYYDLRGMLPGGLHHQNGWISSPANTAIVEGEIVYGGLQALEISPSSELANISHLFGAVEHNEVWEDCFVQLTRQNTPPDLNLMTPAMFYINTEGQLVVYDGNVPTGNWITLTGHPPIEQNTWIRLTIRYNFTDQTWALWLNGANLANGLGFACNVTEYSAVMLKEATNGSNIYYDNISITATQPDGLN